MKCTQMITKKEEEGLKCINVICKHFLKEINSLGIIADVLSLIFYEKKRGYVIHGSSCFNWSCTSYERNPLKTDNLIDLAEPKYETCSNSRWQKLAENDFQLDPYINEKNPSSALYTLETNGIVGVCINSSNFHPEQKSILNKIALKAAYEVKGKSKNIKIIENCAQSIDLDSLRVFREKHDGFLGILSKNKKKIKTSNFPYLMLGELTLKPNDLAIIIALHEKWSVKERLEHGITYGKINRLIKKLGNVRDVIMELTNRNILSNMPNSGNFY